MEKLNVSYYLSERLVAKIDERSSQRSGNRSQQISDDLGKFYDMLDDGLRSALDMLTSDEIRMVIGVIKSRPMASQKPGTNAKLELLGIVDPSVASRIAALDDIACYALWDWARTNR